MHVLALHKVDDLNMEFHMDMYFRQFWNDKRLAFGKSGNAPVSKIKHASLKNRIWVPDPFYVNQKEGKVLSNPADNTLFSIDKDGNYYIPGSTHSARTARCANAHNCLGPTLGR